MFTFFPILTIFGLFLNFAEVEVLLGSRVHHTNKKNFYACQNRDEKMCFDTKSEFIKKKLQFSKIFPCCHAIENRSLTAIFAHFC